MAAKEAVIKGLEKIKAKFEDRDVKQAFRGFNKSVQFLYPDIDFSYVLTVKGGEVTDFREGTVNNPGVILSMDSDTFLAIQNQEITGATALGQGKMRVTGIFGDLFLLEKHLL